MIACQRPPYWLSWAKIDAVLHLRPYGRIFGERMVTDSTALVIVVMGALAFYGFAGWGIWFLRKRLARAAPQNGQGRPRMKAKDKARRGVAAVMVVGLLVVSSGVLQTRGAHHLIASPISVFGAVVTEVPGCTGWPIAFSPLKGYTKASRDAVAASNPRALSVRVAGFCHNLNPSTEHSK